MEDEPLDPKFAELLDLPEDERQKELARLTDEERKELRHHWTLWARRDQLPPAGDWSAWLICAGRGFGKTRAGAEWVREVAKREPEARIALVGASLAEARAVMVEGESGILACSPPHRCPLYEPSLRRLTWANGAQATLYSAAEPESLRGPQHSHAWCDEIAKWDMAGERATRAWDNLLLGLRLGDLPRVLATTTPRPVPLVHRLFESEAKGEIAVTRGTTHANRPNLPERFVEDIGRRFAGTSFARQELGGELLTDIDGALWSRALLEQCRAEGPDGDPAAQPARVVVGVDPPAGARGDACGIVVAGLCPAGKALVLADASVEGASPERWARAVAEAARAWQADRVVAEANQGGAMVASVLRAAELTLPVRLVHASRGKAARAEPVAALYEAGRVRHAGLFAQLEDQMCGLMAAGRYEGPGRSPDRADALVWALTELMLGRRARPRISLI
ncbi:terminase family protein [Pelagerythrobacter marensis]|uniref:Terminase family protein n=1 Tax=Pelagerythrobacter marensis TaxID=543877 RepID=A0ABZ2D3Y1_9SPHN